MSDQGTAVRRVTVVVVVVAFLVGCFPASGGLTLEEHMAMRPAQVLSRFLEASRSFDERTAKQLTGDCWKAVRSWYGSPKIRDHRVPDEEAPPPQALSVMIHFGYSSGSGRERWHARLLRDDARSPWRVCSIFDFDG